MPPMELHRVLYPGTFDPFTLGHLDLVRRGLEQFGSLVVGVSHHPSKNPIFSAEERVAMIQSEVESLGKVEVFAFHGLVVDFANERGIRTILRGVRTISDFEYEYQMALTNRALAPDIETVFVMPSEKYSYLTSSLLKEIHSLGRSLDRFVSPAIAAHLDERLGDAS